MALAIDTIDGRGLSNKARCELLPKSSKIILYVPFVSQEKPFNQLYITNKTERFSFKSGCAMQFAKPAYKRRLAYSVTVRMSA